jgi:hypothetical protein
MGCTNPPRAEGDRPGPDLLNAEALEALDSPDDVHQRVPRAYLMEGDVVRRDAVHPAFGLTKQMEGPDGALPDPLGELGLANACDQFPDLPVGAVGVVVVAVGVVIVLVVMTMAVVMVVTMAVRM